MIVKKNKLRHTLLLLALCLFALPDEAYGQSPVPALWFENPEVHLDWPRDTLPRRTLFAVKTNILFDALTAVNVEVEIPIGNRYSVSAEWIFPWWISDSSQNCFEIGCATIEGKYWFGQRESMPQLIGWAAGFYIGGGYYDIERDGIGYQGENLFIGGVSGSYAHAISRDLRLEFTLGFGMFATKYRKYRAQSCGTDWILVRTERQDRRWFGPTRCRLSLVWMLNRADKRGGVI